MSFPSQPALGTPGSETPPVSGLWGEGAARRRSGHRPAAAQTPARRPPGSGNRSCFSLCPLPIDPTPTESRVAPPPPGFPTPGAPARCPREGTPPPTPQLSLPARPRAPLAAFPRSPPSGLGCSVYGHTTPHPGGASRRRGDPGRGRSLHLQLSSRPLGAKSEFSGLLDAPVPGPECPVPTAAGIPCSRVARGPHVPRVAHCGLSPRPPGLPGPCFPGSPQPQLPAPQRAVLRGRVGAACGRLLTSGSAPWGCICLCFSS